MKILYIRRYDAVNNDSQLNYTNDSVIHGLLDKNYDVIDVDYVMCMSSHPSSNRFSLYGRFNDRINIDRTNILARIKDKEFDYVFYSGSCMDYFDAVTRIYDSNHVAVFDGGDIPMNHSDIIKLSQYCHVFVRELDLPPSNNIHPISFAVPESIFTNSNPMKLKKTSLLIPGDMATYKYYSEEEYFKQYQESRFAFTAKKGGWDCLRHYEIISQRCIPVFVDIGEKPKFIMTNWPMNLQKEANQLFFKPDIDTSTYNDLLNRFFDYAITHFTTKCLVDYVLRCMNHIN